LIPKGEQAALMAICQFDLLFCQSLIVSVMNILGKRSFNTLDLAKHVNRRCECRPRRMKIPNECPYPCRPNARDGKQLEKGG
jgi:hypothetical protein